MRRFLVDPEAMRDGRIRLTGPEARHARTVLRLGAGDQVTLADARGREWLARIDAMDRTGMNLTIIRDGDAVPEPCLSLTLGLAVLKPKAMDLVVEKATELGLARLIPVTAERCAVRFTPQAAAEKTERWRRVAEQAIKQCRRGRPPEILPPMGLDAFLESAAGTDLCLMPDETLAGTAGDPPPWPDAAGSPHRRICGLVGPEGGFAPEERQKARSAGFHPVRLGPRILRAETAALAVIVICGHRYGDLG